MKRLLRCGLSLLLLAAAPARAQTVNFEELQRFADSSLRESETRLLHDATELNAFWHRLGLSGPPPVVDFKQHWLVAVVLGERPTAGYGACVAEVHQLEGRLQILLRETQPDGSQFLPMLPASPGCLAQIPVQPMREAAFSYLHTQQRTPLPMQTLSQISNSLNLTPRLVVVQDAESFRTLWREHTGQLENLPAVDFTQNMVIAAFMGEQPSGGYAITIEEVAEVDGRLVVRLRKRKPRPEDSVIMMLTAPAHLVTVPRRDLPIDFETVE